MAASRGIKVSSNPASASVGSRLYINVECESDRRIGGYELEIGYDPQVVEAVSAHGPVFSAANAHYAPNKAFIAGLVFPARKGWIYLGGVECRARRPGQFTPDIEVRLVDDKGRPYDNVVVERGIIEVKEGDTMTERAEREFEIGKDEAWFANVKRTYDEYQQESLQTIRELRTLFTKIVTDAQQHDNQRQNIANQALQNAVETANMVSKQAVRHADLAIDRQWNIDEVAQLVAKTPVFLDAISAAVIKAVQEHEKALHSK